jgi:hypothetical protein
MFRQKKIKYLTRELGDKTKIKLTISEVLAAVLTKIQIYIHITVHRNRFLFK